MDDNLSSIAPGEEDFPEPPRLRRLRRMVMALTVALTLGILAIAAALVWRLAVESGGARPAATTAPGGEVSADSVTLPKGEEITAIGGDGPRILVSTRAPDGTERIRVFRKSDGAPLGEIAVDRR